MYYSEFHNHKWAKNLAYARRLWQAGRFEALYRGEDMPDGDIFGGLRVIGAYWASVEHEMPLRLASLERGSGHADWLNEPELLEQKTEFVRRYLADMRELCVREDILAPEIFDIRVAASLDMPENWAEQMRLLQQETEKAVETGNFSAELFETWLVRCMRSVANYNHFLIYGGILASAIVRREGADALKAYIDATAEDFKWEVSQAFYATALPQAGFEDIGDLMELGLKGMYADQYYVSGEDKQEGETTIRQSILKNCELAGIYQSVAEWTGLNKTALGYGICRYCEVHGEATMWIVIPPMYHPNYKLLQSLGLHDRECQFELRNEPADDMERILLVQEKIFGPVE